VQLVIIIEDTIKLVKWASLAAAFDCNAIDTAVLKWKLDIEWDISPLTVIDDAAANLRAPAKPSAAQNSR